MNARDLYSDKDSENFEQQTKEPYSVADEVIGLLPVEILNGVFEYLSVTDLTSFRQLSKENKHFIDSYIVQPNVYKQIVGALQKTPEKLLKFFDIYPPNVYLTDPKILLELFSKIDLINGLRIIKKNSNLFQDVYDNYSSQCYPDSEIQLPINDALKIICFTLTTDDINKINKGLYQLALKSLQIKTKFNTATTIPNTQATVQKAFLIPETSPIVDFTIASMLVKTLRVLTAYERFKKQGETQLKALITEFSNQPDIFVNQRNLNLTGQKEVYIQPNANFTGINMTKSKLVAKGGNFYNANLTNSWIISGEGMDLSGANLTGTLINYNTLMTVKFNEETIFKDCQFLYEVDLKNLVKSLAELTKLPNYYLLLVPVAQSIILQVEDIIARSILPDDIKRADEILAIAINSPLFQKVEDSAISDPRLFTNDAAKEQSMQNQARLMLITCKESRNKTLGERQIRNDN